MHTLRIIRNRHTYITFGWERHNKIRAFAAYEIHKVSRIAHADSILGMLSGMLSAALSAYVSIRQSIRQSHSTCWQHPWDAIRDAIRDAISSPVSLRQHTSAYVSIRQSIRQAIRNGISSPSVASWTKKWMLHGRKNLNRFPRMFYCTVPAFLLLALQ